MKSTHLHHRTPRRSWLAAILLSGLLATLPAAAAQSIQTWLDMALPGSTLRLPAGEYSGPGVISKALTLEGGGKVIINNGGKGTVLTVKADHVKIGRAHV